MSTDNTSGSFTMLYSLKSQFVNNFYKYSTLVINHARCSTVSLASAWASQNKTHVSITNTASLASVSISRRTMVKTNFMRSEKYVHLLFCPTLTKTGMLTHFSRSPKYGNSHNSIQWSSTLLFRQTWQSEQPLFAFKGAQNWFLEQQIGRIETENSFAIGY